MNYLIVPKASLASAPRFPTARAAERGLRDLEDGLYVILRLVADDVVVTPLPPVQPARKVVIGTRSFTRRRKGAEGEAGVDGEAVDEAGSGQ